MGNFVLFQVFLAISLFFMAFRGWVRGWKSELISMGSGLIGLLAALSIYRPGAKHFVVSVSIFSAIYLFGLAKSGNYKSERKLDMIFGLLVSMIKFVLLVAILLAIGMAFDFVPKEYLDSAIFKILKPAADWIQKNVFVHFLSK